ncbi:TrmH family RNA methyltransferase [Flavobacterium sp.]|uniref:TrmH family RNA methyltransferase n=1 Tax=Flavobacterium sp. TaxID=239 RepID=UPI002A81DAF7|nr:TrmH family RNA methyltransferase [Flavobacterium sp.]
MEQLNHYNIEFQEHNFPITVICDEVYFQQNIGSIFRICDAFGVEKIIFTGENFIISERKVNKTSRNTHKTVPFEVIKDKNEVIRKLQEINYQIIALEITDLSTSIDKIKLTNQPILLIVGSEVYGVSKELLDSANIIAHIPMFGKNSSMNVANSLSISLYEITKQLSL